jgi:hypothetical protein
VTCGGAGYGAYRLVPWLTSLETPVSVIMLTGALVDGDGRAVRICTEGMLARRTCLLASSVGAQALIRDDNVYELRSSRRDDLPGHPLDWRCLSPARGAALTKHGRGGPDACRFGEPIVAVDSIVLMPRSGSCRIGPAWPHALCWLSSELFQWQQSRTRCPRNPFAGL